MKEGNSERGPVRATVQRGGKALRGLNAGFSHFEFL